MTSLGGSSRPADGAGMRPGDVTHISSQYQAIFVARTRAEVAHQSFLRVRVGQRVLSPASLFATNDPEAVLAWNTTAVEVAIRDRPAHARQLVLRVEAEVARPVILAIRKAIDGHLEPSAVIVEVQYSATGGASIAQALSVITIAHAQGMRTAIAAVDDVKNLAAYLVAADILKLDRGLLRSETGSAERIVEQAHAQGLTVLAFGIESDADLKRARTLGVDWVQGTFLAPPV